MLTFLPYLDVNPDSKFFKAIQKIGATGILRGEGKNAGWENQTLFYPDSLLSRTALQTGLNDIAPELSLNSKDQVLTGGEALAIIQNLMQLGSDEKGNMGRELPLTEASRVWKKYGMGAFRQHEPMTRAAFCLLLDELADPFTNWPVDHWGNFSF